METWKEWIKRAEMEELEELASQMREWIVAGDDRDSICPAAGMWEDMDQGLCRMLCQVEFPQIKKWCPCHCPGVVTQEQIMTLALDILTTCNREMMKRETGEGSWPITRGERGSGIDHPIDTDILSRWIWWMTEKGRHEVCPFGNQCYKVCRKKWVFLEKGALYIPTMILRPTCPCMLLDLVEGTSDIGADYLPVHGMTRGMIMESAVDLVVEQVNKKEGER